MMCEIICFKVLVKLSVQWLSNYLFNNIVEILGDKKPKVFPNTNC
jgi:hypothetical protein